MKKLTLIAGLLLLAFTTNAHEIVSANYDCKDLSSNIEISLNESKVLTITLDNNTEYEITKDCKTPYRVLDSTFKFECTGKQIVIKEEEINSNGATIGTRITTIVQHKSQINVSVNQKLKLTSKATQYSCLEI